jgi:hypothetical protein
MGFLYNYGGTQLLLRVEFKRADEQGQDTF